MMCESSSVYHTMFYASDGTSVMAIIQLVSGYVCYVTQIGRHTDAHGQVQSDPEGALWRDPPNYFEQIVYPAYVRAHNHIFTDGNIETGRPNEKVKDLLLIDSEGVGMDEVLDRACKAVLDVAQR